MLCLFKQNLDETLMLLNWYFLNFLPRDILKRDLCNVSFMLIFVLRKMKIDLKKERKAKFYTIKHKLVLAQSSILNLFHFTQKICFFITLA